ncbi:MAG: hypothetical protein GKC10_02830 [Methanosarcinales archaeon]|nr:hypothetical protein [Methanosarcinales archaeon]
MSWEWIGALGALLTMFGFLPQVVKILRTRSVEDVSLPMLFQFSLGTFMWLVYGFGLENTILVVSSSVSLAFYLAGLALYFRYSSRPRMENPLGMAVPEAALAEG